MRPISGKENENSELNIFMSKDVPINSNNSISIWHESSCAFSFVA